MKSWVFILLMLVAGLPFSGCGGGTTAPTAYTVGGTVSGLSGSGLVLQNNGGDNLAIDTNGGFAFTTPVVNGGAYKVTVLTQPSNPTQNCVVTNGSGTAGNSNVTSVVLGCVGVWAWVDGAVFANQGGFSGTQGEAAPGNVPGARNYAFGSTDAVGNLWLYGGNGYNSGGVYGPVYGPLGDLWKFGGGGWAWLSGSQLAPGQSGIYGTLGVAAPSNDPGWRQSAVSWTDSAGNFWFFGGNGLGSGPGSSGWLNDLWRYSAGEWTWMGGSNVVDQVGVYGNQGTPASSNIPGARSDAVGWRDPAGDFWLFGGTGFDSDRASDYGWLNDLWKYSGGQWTWMGGSDAHYQPGVYGGQGVPAPSNIPGARFAAVGWTDGAGDFWLFGGFGEASAGSSGFLNDLWRYSAGEWTWISGSNVADQQGTYGIEGVAAPSNTPGPRQYAVGWTDAAGNLWLFGGSDLGGNFNDLWKFSAGQWTWMGGNIGSLQNNQPGIYGNQGTVAPTNQPGARQQAVGWVDSTGAFWLFGGSGYDSTGTLGFLNDQWKYEP